jgi:MFS family permease
MTRQKYHPDCQSFGSANIASAALSPIFARLLNQYGPRTTLIGWTVFIAVAISLGILCIRPRRRHGARVDADAHEHEVTLKPFKSPYFWLFVSSMAVQSLANNLPANYLQAMRRILVSTLQKQHFWSRTCPCLVSSVKSLSEPSRKWSIHQERPCPQLAY